MHPVSGPVCDADADGTATHEQVHPDAGCRHHSDADTDFPFTMHVSIPGSTMWSW